MTPAADQTLSKVERLTNSDISMWLKIASQGEEMGAHNIMEMEKILNFLIMRCYKSTILVQS